MDRLCYYPLASACTRGSRRRSWSTKSKQGRARGEGPSCCMEGAMKPYDTGRRGASPGRQSVLCVYSKRRTRTPKKSKTTKSLHYRRNNRGGGVRNPRSCTAANMFCIILNQAMPDGIRTHFLLTVGAQPREQRRRSVMTLTSCAASWRVCCGRRPIQDSLLRHQLRLALARLLRVGGWGGEERAL